MTGRAGLVEMNRQPEAESLAASVLAAFLTKLHIHTEIEALLLCKCPFQASKAVGNWKACHLGIQ